MRHLLIRGSLLDLCLPGLPYFHRPFEILAGVAGDAVAHQSDRAAVAGLAERGEELPVVEVALVQRLDQPVGPGLRASFAPLIVTRKILAAFSRRIGR